MEHPEEGARLEAKTDVLEVERQLVFAGLAAGMRALDVGCGTGAVTRVIARVIAADEASKAASWPTAVGVDRSESRVRQARELAKRGVNRSLSPQFVHADATRLPFDDSTFDFAWSRFLFEYLSDPRRALTEMVRVVKPGGVVAVADLDGQIEQFFPLSASLDRELHLALSQLRSLGFDQHVGRKLFSWFCESGLRDIAARVIPYQVYTGGVPEHEWPNWHAKITTATDFLSNRAGDMTRWTRLRTELAHQLRRSNVFYYSSLIIVSGRTK